MAAIAREFQVFVKPAGAACNLECRYCYYLEKWDGSGIPRMSDGLLETCIAQQIDASPGRQVWFSWHGGEPTLLGLDFFRRVVEIQARHARPGRAIANGIQTNGVLLDERWAAFLAENRFHVGLSIDGPADLHDAERVTCGGGGSHAQAVRALGLLQRYDVPTDILCVVHSRNVAEPIRVYRFLRKLGATSLAFLPAVKADPAGRAGVSPHTVPAEAYGRFLCEVFDEWVDGDRRRIEVQIFEEASRPARGLEHRLCIFRPTCGDVAVVERDGSFYSCDHFVDEAHRLGNIAETPLAAMVDAPAQRAFGLAKRASLPRQCLACDVLPMCNGGCPKDRFVNAADGEPGLNYLCPAFKRFFTHVLPWAVRVGLESRPATPVSFPNTGAAALSPRLPARPPVGRNDPCPCGSGRKYKKCCGPLPAN